MGTKGSLPEITSIGRERVNGGNGNSGTAMGRWDQDHYMNLPYTSILGILLVSTRIMLEASSIRGLFWT